MADHLATLLFAFGDDISVRWLITVLHFLWQGAVVGVTTAIAGRLLRGASARSRYALHSIALISLPICMVVTFCSVKVPVGWKSSTHLHSSAQVSANLPALPLVGSATTTTALGQTREDNPSPRLKDRVTAHNWVITNAVTNDDSEPLLHSALAVIAPAAPWIALAYVVGAACLLLRLSAALWGGHRLRVLTAPVTDATLLQRIADQADRLRLRCVPVVGYCERVAVPTVLGVLRPVVLLPLPVITGLTPDEFAAIIRHELAHIRRYDLWMNLLQRVIESLLFFHPVVWWISHRMSAEREICCDDLVVSSGCEPMRYAGALLRVAEMCATWSKPGTPALTVTGDKTTLLERRIERLMNWNRSPRLQLTRAGMAGVMLAFVSVIALPVIAHSWAQAPAPAGDPQREEHIAAHDTALDDTALPGNKSAGQSVTTEQSGRPRSVGAKVIRGIVVDQQGEPIAGAELWHEYAIVGLTGKHLGIHATSDDAGKFTLEIPPLPNEKESLVSALPGGVWIYSPSHCLKRAALRSASAPRSFQDLRVVLSPTTDTSFVILDPNDRPVPEANITPREYGVEWDSMGMPDGLMQRVSGRTDTDGRVLLPTLACGSLYSVSVTTEEFGTQIQRFTVDPSTPGERTIRLRPVCRIEGQVIAGKPEWIHGLRCTITTFRSWKRGENRNQALLPPYGYAEVTPDEQGHFAIPALAEGFTSHLSAQYDSRWPVEPVLPRIGRLEAGSTVSLEIPLRRTAIAPTEWIVGPEFLFMSGGIGIDTGWVHVDNSQVTPATNDTLTVTAKFANAEKQPLRFNVSVSGGGADSELTCAASGTIELSVTGADINSASEFWASMEMVTPRESEDKAAFDDYFRNYNGSMGEARRIKGLTHNIRSADKSVTIDWGDTHYDINEDGPHLCVTTLARSPVGHKTRVKVFNVNNQGSETLLTTINLTDGQADKEMSWTNDVALSNANKYASACWKLKFQKETEQISNQQVTVLGTDIRFIGDTYNKSAPPSN